MKLLKIAVIAFGVLVSLVSLARWLCKPREGELTKAHRIVIPEPDPDIRGWQYSWTVPMWDRENMWWDE